MRPDPEVFVLNRTVVLCAPVPALGGLELVPFAPFALLPVVMFMARCAGIFPLALADIGITAEVLPDAADICEEGESAEGGEDGREGGLMVGSGTTWVCCCCSVNSSCRVSRRCLIELEGK